MPLLFPADLKKIKTAFFIFPCLCLLALSFREKPRNGTGAEYGPLLPVKNADEIQQLIDKAKPGDTVFIPRGIYKLNDLPIRPAVSGNRNAWITIMPLKGNEVIIDGENYLSSYTKGQPPLSGSVTFKDCRYIRLEGIEVRNSHNAGIIIQGNQTDHIEIIRCKSGGSFNSGISIWYADSCKILYCEVTGANNKELKPKSVPFKGEAPHEAISLAGASHFEVAFNVVHDCFKEGIDCKEVSKEGVIHHNIIYNMPRQGLYTDCWFGHLSQVIFHHNTVYNCEWGFAISGEGKNASMDSIYFHHNLLYNNRASGIFLSVWGSDEERKNIFIYNNTIYNNGKPGHWSGLTGGIDIMTSHLKNVFIYNNIIANNYGYAIGLWAEDGAKDSLLKNRNIKILDNLEWQVSRPANETPKSIFKIMYPIKLSSDIQSDPLFTDAAKGNFGLSPSSPARREGWPEAPTGETPFIGALDPDK
jgi:hypothetical protein